MIRLLLGLGCALYASAALSLSCMPQSGQSMYRFAADAPDRYLPVVGKLLFDEDQIQRIPTLGSDGVEDINAPRGASFKAQIVGKALTRLGFNAPFDGPVTVTVSCAGPWCGAVPKDHDLLVLLKETDAGYQVDVGACGGNVMVLRDGAADAFVQCHKGGPCEDPFN